MLNLLAGALTSESFDKLTAPALVQYIETLPADDLYRVAWIDKVVMLVKEFEDKAVIGRRALNYVWQLDNEGNALPVVEPTVSPEIPADDPEEPVCTPEPEPTPVEDEPPV